MASQNKIDYSLPKWFYLAIAAVISLIFLFILYANGWITYSSRFIQCGFKQPIYAYSTPGIAGAKVKMLYALPGEETYRIANEFNVFGYHKYYCTEEDARNNDYRHDAS
jgi:hypothetical protein